MRAFERRWAEIVLAAFAPPAATALGEGSGEANGALQPRPGEVRYLESYETMRSHGTRLSAFGLRLAVWIVVWSPPFLGLGLCLFPTLTPERRALALERLLHSKRFLVRELTLLLKIVAAMALFGTPSIRARSGYDRAPALAPTLERAQEGRG
ncbi:MAG: hypothetical protein D6729_08245 [Deltaproteobacteria bacterium]|nr:MAG: hypothetical protein D6729_08245 [Deltaproteobacteria bacterium]